MFSRWCPNTADRVKLQVWKTRAATANLDVKDQQPKTEAFYANSTLYN